MAKKDDLKVGMRVKFEKFVTKRITKGTVFKIEYDEEKVWCYWGDDGHKGWMLMKDVQIMDEPLYQLGTRLKVIDPYQSTANSIKGEIVEVVGNNMTHLGVKKVDDKKELVWYVSNLGKYEIVVGHGKMSDLGTKVKADGSSSLKRGVLKTIKGEDKMNSAKTTLEHMDVGLSIDLKEGGYLVKANTKEQEAEAVSKQYMDAIGKAIVKIKDKENEEIAREGEIERIKGVLERNKKKLEELRGE